jgi:hypothetical protein
MLFLLERQLPLNGLSVCKYLLYVDTNQITVEGLQLMPNSHFSQLNYLNLGHNIFI